ncbi:MAG: UrcA family protein [Proteobacteria bacterium]|nr:UrcA family protein [Pseudomonadota bacterium]
MCKIRLSPRRRALAAITLAAFVAPAAFAAGDAPRTIHVRYDDLNLGSDAGTQALYRRLARAATRVCELEGLRDLASLHRAELCYRDALHGAVAAVNNERLSALYHAREPNGAT